MLGVSWIQQLVLVVMIVTSAAIFWRRLSAVLHVIRGSRLTPDFEVAPVGPRIRDFFWEVMAQAKVIQQRPLPGLAHAFVFWGFLAFGLITLNHIATGFGYPFLKEGSIYAYVAGAFAIAVAVSITGLFVRRFVVRPKWLGDHVSKESG